MYLNKMKNEKKYKYYENDINEITILVDIEEEDIKKEIYFLDNLEKKLCKDSKDYHGNLKELNIFNTELYINNKKEDYKKYLVPEKVGINEIKIKFKNNLSDCSYMFAGCEKISNIYFNSFNTKNITNMKCMFFKCQNLKSISLYSFDTQMVKNMSCMFYKCIQLNNIDIFFFDTKNVTDMSNMFNGCSSLTTLPDIYNWNTQNVNNMCGIIPNPQSPFNKLINIMILKYL